MNNTDITNKLNELASNWEQFKVVNDRRLYEIEQKGGSDPLTVQHMHKLNSRIDEQENAITQLQLHHQRPNMAKFIPFSDQEHKTAFCQYVRKGQGIDALRHLEQKALSGIHLADSENGYLITSQMAEQIADDLASLSPMRQLASVTEIATDALELLDSNVDNMAGWTAEVQDYNNTSSVKIDKKLIPVHELFAQPKVTQKLLDDPRIDIEKWLAQKLTEVFLAKENHAFINGDGAGKPQGILAHKQGSAVNEIEAIPCGNKGSFTADNIIKLFYSLPEQYAVGAKFLMSRSAVQMARTLKDNNNNYLWQPRLQESAPDLLLGAEVVLSTDMPAVTANNTPIIYANFKRGYHIADRHAVRILRDPYTDKPFVKFYSTKKVGGGVVNPVAIKVLKLSN